MVVLVKYKGEIKMLKKATIFFLVMLVILSCSNYTAFSLTATIDQELPDVLYGAQNTSSHSRRASELENNLSTIVYENNDETNTMYLFSEPVKYIDSEGVIKDKSTVLIENLVSKSKYKYKNKANQFDLFFPDIINSENGVLFSAEDYQIEKIR